MVSILPRPRLYDALLLEHCATRRQMAFVSGPRGVGKTVTCRRCADACCDWDDPADRERVLAGPDSLAAGLGAERLSKTFPVVLFDELHRFPRWKALLEHLHDTRGDRLRFIVAASSRMDAGRGRDSLRGRYRTCRMHPFSVAETARPELPDPRRVTRSPRAIDAADFEALWRHGGWPEPFLARDVRFSRRWRARRLERLVGEDVRDLTQVRQLDQLRLLARRLAGRSARRLAYGAFAREIGVSIDTLRRWVADLCGLHLGFLVRPAPRGVPRSLRREPRWYLRDWAGVDDEDDRAETFVACHLLKAVDGWNDLGLGRFELGYLRDKEKRKVDFLVARDGRPWLLADAGRREAPPGAALRYYQALLGAPFAFQVAVDAEYVDADCFAAAGGPPRAVPARTLLSQLL